jgi:pimeloyl-ACP methyl ester carboxylesterase
MSPRLSLWREGGRELRWRGLRLFFKDEGQGAPVLLLHGYPTGSFDWHAIWPRLLPRHRLIAPDFAGLGFSDKPVAHDYSLASHAQAVEALLEALGLAMVPVHVVAHDLGVRVAQELLARAEQRRGAPRFASLVLLNGAMCPEAYRPRLIQRLLASPLGASLGPRIPRVSFDSAIRALFARHNPPSPELLDDFWALVEHGDGRRSTHVVGRFWRVDPAQRERLVGALLRNTARLRVINGADDPNSGRHMLRRWLELAPNGNVVSLDGVGHWPQIEAPQATAAAILDFLGQPGSDDDAHGVVGVGAEARSPLGMDGDPASLATGPLNQPGVPMPHVTPRRTRGSEHCNGRRRLMKVALPGLIFGAVPALAAAPLSAAGLRQDLALWRRAVLDRHPRWHGRSRLDEPLEAAFERTARELDDTMAPRAAYARLSRINPYLQDAHTLLMPWLDGREPNAATRERQFPMGVELTPDGTLRLRSHWRHGRDGIEFPAGSALLRLNDQPVPALLQRLAAHSHGETATLRMHMLTLMWPHWLDAVLGWQNRFDLQLRQPDGRETRVTVATDGAWRATRVPPEMPTLRRFGEGIHVLRVPTLDVDEDPARFARAVRQAFATLREQRATRLVIDLRGNTGGQSDAGAEILRALIEQPARQVSRAVERLNAENNGWFGYRGAPGTMREFDVSSEGLVQPLPVGERWRGRVAALVDEMSYSATLLLATALQDHKLAMLVGRVSGGYANQTGNMMPTRLPHSGFTAFVATREFVRPSGDPRLLPLVPDIVVPHRAGEADSDEVLARAIAWLQAAR